MFLERRIRSSLFFALLTLTFYLVFALAGGFFENENKTSAHPKLKPSFHTLSVDPSSLDLTANVGQTVTAAVTLTGGDVEDGVPIMIQLLSITDGGPNFFIDTPLSSTSLDNNQTGVFKVGFKPTAAGTFTGLISIVSENAPSVSISLRGAGTEAAAGQLSVQPASIDFGSVAVGQNAQRPVTLRNVGTAPITVSSATVTGGANLGFSASAPSATSLVPNQTTTLNVGFAPQTAGQASGTLTVTSTGGNATVALRGAGSAGASLQVSPTTINFGDVSFSQSVTRTATVSNTGGTLLNLSSVTIMSGGDLGFSVSPPSATALAPGQMVNLNIAFAPKSIGAANGVLMIVSDAGNAIIMLLGNSKDDVPPMVTLASPRGGETLTAGTQFNIQFNGSDNNAIGGFTAAFSTDGGATFPNQIGRAAGSATSVVWNIPDLLQTTQAQIRVTAQDLSGNSASASSGTFVVQMQPQTRPILQVLITFDPPPANQIAPPQNVTVTATEFMQPPIAPNQTTTAPLAGFNIYRVPAPPEGQPIPSAEDIVGDPRNLIASVPAGAKNFTDTVATSKGDNFIYSLTSFFGNGMQSSGSPPAGTNLPVIKNPTFTKGALALDARGSFIKDGAMLIIDDKESFVLKLDASGLSLIVDKKALSAPSGQKLKKLLKKDRASRIRVKNTDGKFSIAVTFTRV